MGKIVDKKFDIQSDYIIDYANNPLRSDFMDIYLGAKCLFCLTTQTGYDGVIKSSENPSNSCCLVVWKIE